MWGRLRRIGRTAIAYGQARRFAWRYRVPSSQIVNLSHVPKGRLALFLLAGQSNMAGQARVEERDTHPHPRVLMLGQSGQWQAAREPLHRKRFQLTGTGPGMAFGRAIAEAWPDHHIGLIPCAMGGSALQHWLSDEPFRAVYLYERAITQTKRALRDGTLCACLWHQGESNATPRHYSPYRTLLPTFFDQLRHDLDHPKLPVLLGEIGRWLPEDLFPHANAVNDIIRQYVSTDPLAQLVPSADLAHGGDRVHFSSQAARELGRRYAEVLTAISQPPA